MKTAKQRLAHYRAQAQSYVARHPDHIHYTQWQHWMTRTTKVPSTICRDTDNPKILYVESLQDLGWREVGEAQDVDTSIKHNGWYADNFQADTIKGAVLQLPARNGEELYVPATFHSDYETATVYLADIGPDKNQAARDADWYAEKEAERNREFDAKDQAERKIEEAREEIHRINKDALTLIKEIKGKEFTPAICAALKGTLRDYLSDRRQQFKMIVKLQDDFWSAVPQ